MWQTTVGYAHPQGTWETDPAGRSMPTDSGILLILHTIAAAQDRSILWLEAVPPNQVPHHVVDVHAGLQRLQGAGGAEDEL